VNDREEVEIIGEIRGYQKGVGVASIEEKEKGNEGEWGKMGGDKRKFPGKSQLKHRNMGSQRLGARLGGESGQKNGIDRLKKSGGERV